MIKKFPLLILLICMAVFFSVSAYALTYPDSFYDSIAWTWEYSAPATSSYNCLGYATGSMVWEWPWGGSDPTSTQVTTYLKSKGYSTSGSTANTYVLSYGSTSDITHFSRVTGTSWCRAKWGSLERFNHGSWNPYTPNGGYGPLVKKYYIN